MHTVGQKKRQFCKYYTLLWAKKVNSMPLFSEFSRKNYCFCGHTLLKTCILSPANSSNVYILLKNVHSLKTWCSHVIFLRRKYWNIGIFQYIRPPRLEILEYWNIFQYFRPVRNIGILEYSNVPIFPRSPGCPRSPGSPVSPGCPALQVSKAPSLHRLPSGERREPGER